MAVIKAQKIPQKEKSLDDILAQFCYYYPQYTFHKASKVPVKRIRQMLRVAFIERARFMHDLTSIVVAPHTKKGIGVKKLHNYFKSIIDS